MNEGSPGPGETPGQDAQTSSGLEVQPSEAKQDEGTPVQEPVAAKEQTERKSSTGDKAEDEQSILREWIELLVRAGIWAILIYLFIFQVSLVEQDSMNPSFYEGDKLVIDKLTYHFFPVQRFDVIVFETIDTGNSPRRPKDYIKRVIGLPGETVEIRDGSVWVNGQKINDKFGPTYVNAPEGQIYVVPPHHFFVMGDNRSYSKDSRSELGLRGRESLGFVPEGQIRGVVRLRFWPWSRFAWFGR